MWTFQNCTHVLRPTKLLGYSVDNFGSRKRVNSEYSKNPTRIPREVQVSSLKHMNVVLVLVLVHPIYYLRHSFLSPSYSGGNSDLGSRSRLFFPLPTTVHALHLYRDKTCSALASLADWRRFLCLPVIGALSSRFLLFFFLQINWFLLFFLHINSQSHHGGIRTLGPTLSIALRVAFEGNH